MGGVMQPRRARRFREFGGRTKIGAHPFPFVVGLRVTGGAGDLNHGWTEMSVGFAL